MRRLDFKKWSTSRAGYSFKKLNSVKYTTLDFTTPHHIKSKKACGNWLQAKPYSHFFFDLGTKRIEYRYHLTEEVSIQLGIRTKD